MLNSGNVSFKRRTYVFSNILEIMDYLMEYLMEYLVIYLR